MTHATVKDYIASYIQRTYQYGKDIAVSLRDQKKDDMGSERPTRSVSAKTDDGRKLEQDHFDIL